MAMNLLSTTIPTIVAIGVTGEVAKQAFTNQKGKAIGSKHWHYLKGKPYSHKHEGGHITHYHPRLKGYGKTRKTLKK